MFYVAYYLSSACPTSPSIYRMHVLQLPIIYRMHVLRLLLLILCVFYVGHAYDK